MPPFATLYTSTSFLHARVLKTLSAANFNNLTIEIPPNFEYGVTNQSPEYKSKFPHGKMPALCTPSGFNLSESTAIAYYIADSGPAREQLLGRTVEERALVQMWSCFSDQEIFSHFGPILNCVLGRAKYNPEVVDPKEKEFVRALKRLELHLEKEGKTWLVRDDEVSLADLSVAGTLYWPLKFFLDEETRKEYPKIMQWWERLMAVEEVGKVFEAPIKMCEKRPTLGATEFPK